MRIAVVAGPAAGHAFPAASLALALRARGHEVVMLTGRRWLAPLARDGLEATELPMLARTPRDDDFGYLLWGRSVEMTPAVEAQLRHCAVDGVVCDTLTVAGAFAAQRLGLPWVELVPHPVQDPSRSLPPPGSGLAPARTGLGRGRDRVLGRLSTRAYAEAARQRAAARAALGLPGDGCPQARLVATLPALEAPRPDWRADTHVVGPLEWDPAALDIVPPPGRGPLVVLSASTAPTGTAGLLPCALSGLGGHGGDGIRLVATQLEAASAPVPPWAVVGPGRQAPLLDAASLVVSGAGHGTVAKALARGRPLVLVPGGGEQFDNARRVARLGAGVVIPPGRLSPRRLGTAVARVLADERYAEAAGAVAATARGLGPAYAAGVAERALGGVSCAPYG